MHRHRVAASPGGAQADDGDGVRSVLVCNSAPTRGFGVFKPLANHGARQGHIDEIRSEQTGWSATFLLHTQDAACTRTAGTLEENTPAANGAVDRRCPTLGINTAT
jgi:hypothetical protein